MRYEGFFVTIEFRSASWLDAQQGAALKIERDNACVNVIVDEPRGFKSAVPAVGEVTNGALAIVQLRGRNVAIWEAQG